jgi:hypothetical protein
MAVVTKATLKTYFQDGKEPDENKFINLIDSLALVSGVPGHFTIGDGAGAPKLYIDGLAGQHRSLIFQTGGVNRWWVRAANQAETGGNVGSDFEISGRNDAGGWLNTPIRIIRSTGDVYLAKNVFINGGVQIKEGFTPTTGMGLELEWDGAQSDILSYNRDTSTYLPLRLRGSTIIFREASDTVLTIDDGDVYTVPLISYHGSSDIIGWASTTELRIFYKKVGKTVHCTFRIQGTSNSNACSFTLPYQRTGSAYHFENTIHVRNNGAHAYGHVLVASTKLIFYRSANTSATSWSTTGTKSIWGQVWYETD